MKREFDDPNFSFAIFGTGSEFPGIKGSKYLQRYLPNQEIISDTIDFEANSIVENTSRCQPKCFETLSHNLEFFQAHTIKPRAYFFKYFIKNFEQLFEAASSS